METHYIDILTKESECGKGRGLTLNIEDTTCNIEDTTCRDCLESVKREWERQTKTFKGYPLINAKNGLKNTLKRIKEVSLSV